MSRAILFSMLVLGSVVSAHVVAAEPVEFLGVKVEGKNIAFVCDGSRWMKNKVDDLAEELGKAVEALAADQQVSITYFADDKAYGPNDAKPLAATAENK